MNSAVIYIVTMENEAATQEVVNYGQGLVKILQGFKTVETKAGWFERLLIRVLRATYQHRLRTIIGLIPAEAGDQILGTMDFDWKDR